MRLSFGSLNLLLLLRGLTLEDCRRIERKYLKLIEDRALEDGEVTQEEYDLIKRFSDILKTETSIEVSERQDVVIQAGSLVCVTGTCTYKGKLFDKEEMQRLLERLGHRFTDQLNKRDGVGLLLCADINSSSGKVKKAKAWGIQRMSIQDFLMEREKADIQILN